MSLRRSISIVALTICSLGINAAQAQAAPIWNLDIHHNQTHFPPGGEGQYWFDTFNVGDTATSGPIKLIIELPPGLTRRALIPFVTASNFKQWKCPGKAGATIVTCETSESIPRHSLSNGLAISVNVAPEATGTLVAKARIEGGGAANVAATEEPTEIDSEPAGFGIVSSSFVPDFFESDGLTTEREAGGHPDLFTVPFDLNTYVPSPDEVPLLTHEAENIRDLGVDLPLGFVGNPNAVGECTQAAFTSGKCPRSTIVGREDLLLFPSSGGPQEVLTYSSPVYNLSHPRGSISDLAFIASGNPVHIKVSLDPSNHYAITTETPDINETFPPYSQKLTLWGVPADHSHDSEGCNGGGFTLNTSGDCPTDDTPRPFLSLPSQCESPSTFRLHHYDSWQNKGVFGPEIDYTMPGLITNCDRPRFEPDVEIEPTGKQANTPTGLDVHVKVAQNENPNALATPPVKRFTVKLPEGMSFSPSFADGLSSCTLAQMQLGNNNPVECPDASRIGEVELHTPLLPKSAEGSMYLAAQGDNPFGSTFASDPGHPRHRRTRRPDQDSGADRRR